MLAQILAVVFLLAANAFFVAAEFALVKARRPRLETMAEGGSKPARLTLRVSDQLEVYLAACQLGITMASLGLGWVGEPVAAALIEPIFHLVGLPEAVLHTAAFVIGFLLFSSLHIVLGEQVPKTFAIRQPEPVSLLVAAPLHAFYIVCWPLNWALNAAAGGILRLFGIKEGVPHEAYSPDELRGLIDSSREQGALRKRQHDMLDAILDLDKVEVGEVMTHRRNIVSLSLDTPVAEVVQRTLEGPHTRYPVWSGDSDQIVGVLHVKDLLAAVRRSTDPLSAADLRRLLSPPWFVPDTTSLVHQLLAFRQRKAHLAFVVDEYGTLQGLITLEDILEEIVGDIVDEKDVEVAGVRSEPGGGVLVEGRVTIRDLNRQFDWELPDEEATTVAGLVMHEARRIPNQGETFAFHGFRFEVLRRQRHQLTLLRLTPERPEGAAGQPAALPAPPAEEE